MAVVYATLIIKGKKTIEQVPGLIREQVREILLDMDLPELAEQHTFECAFYIERGRGSHVGMELEAQVKQHEDKLKQHDKEISRLYDVSIVLQISMNEGLARVDESNRFLREQNTRQSEQNAEILREVLNRNKEEEEHKHELRMIDKTNIWKLILGIGGGAGVVFAFVLELLKFLRG